MLCCFSHAALLVFPIQHLVRNIVEMQRQQQQYDTWINSFHKNTTITLYCLPRLYV